MSSTIGYKKLGLEPIDPFQDQQRRDWQKHTGDENKDDGAGDPFKMFLKESLLQKRNKMMDNFALLLI